MKLLSVNYLHISTKTISKNEPFITAIGTIVVDEFVEDSSQPKSLFIVVIKIYYLRHRLVRHLENISMVECSKWNVG